MGWLEIILFAIGATILAINQLLKDVPAVTLRFPTLRPRGWWNYVPFAFLVAAGFVYVVRLMLPGTLATTASLPVVTGVPIERILSFYHGDQTELEADRLARPFIGVSVGIRGTVRSVSGSPGLRIAWLNEEIGQDVRVAIVFSPTQDDFAERLHVNEAFEGRCILDRVTRYSVVVEQCTITGARDPAAAVATNATK